MEPEKLIQLQHQMRENSTEYQDFLHDLDGWADDIKKKDKQLKSEPIDSTLDYPPIRNSLGKKKLKKKKNPDENKPNRINAYDFRSWDKYDADAALKELDSGKVEEDEVETDEEWEEKRLKEQSILHKDMGNQRFKEGKYDEAVECYTNAIKLDPLNAIYLSNRAMALLKQEKFAAAEQDSSIAISINGSFCKAYYRRAIARIALNKLQEAKMDLEKLLDLEPNNKLALTELRKIERTLYPQEFNDTAYVKAVLKPLNKRSKKPLKKIIIEEVGLPVVSQKPKENLEDPKIQAELPIPPVPSSSVQLQKAWMALSNNQNRLYTYFKKINPIMYAKLFGSWFDFKILKDIVVMLNLYYINNVPLLFEILKNLIMVKRFSTAYMLLEKNYKEDLKQLIVKISNDETVDKTIFERFLKDMPK